MDLKNFLKKSEQEINTELKSFFPRKIDKQWIEKSLGEIAFELDENAIQKSIVDPIWDFLDRGGKRLRPMLMILACEAVGSQKSVLPFTVIPELIHNGTLIADDVEDNSSLRRGKPATHLTFGLDIAVNASNILYYLPLTVLFNNSQVSAEKKALVYELCSKAMLRVSLGQGMDIWWHNNQGNVTEQQYLQMCSYKTGSLIRLAMELGAIFGNSTKNQRHALANFGTNFGVAFQIKDDILNLKSNKKLGKEIGDDIKEGKMTIMVIKALESLEKSKREKLLNILNSRKNGEEEIREAISLLEEADAINYSRKVADEIASKAWGQLEKSLPDSEAKAMLKEIILERKV